MGNTIEFIGEHLFVGNLGKFFVALSLVASILGVLAYFMASNSEDTADGPSWKKLARWSFVVHALSVFGIFFTLFYIIHAHYFEYAYAWQHSSLTLPIYYMISCFWEGQEGSFLLWMFWHAVLGLLLIKTTKKWEAPVMAVVCLSQVVLSTMILGIDVGTLFKLGSSPFELLRIAKPDLLNIPILQSVGGAANYLKVITDGTGLNPLLQNYWMVIHPPTLFLGFASSIIPFAFVIAALWKRDYNGWIKPAMPWTLFCIMILGTGIIMGGFWAYESLSFGGYWAWDPVENASLLPWLVIIAGVHVMLIHKSTGNSLILAMILAASSFILVLYATFLTRSGILGDTSVHSFTDLGLAGQLMVFLFMFIALLVLVSFKSDKFRIGFGLLLVALFIVNLVADRFLKIPNMLFFIVSAIALLRNLYKNLPLSSKEESTWSREFWMFIGSLILLLSAFHVMINTSIPVLNKITTSFAFLLEPLAKWTGITKFADMAHGTAAPPTDVVTFYNRWQLPIAIVIAALTAIGQHFKYKKSNKGAVIKNILIAFIAAIILTIAGIFIFDITQPMLIGLLLTSCYAITGNSWYIIKVLKGKIRLSGGSVAHVGLGFMLIGILVSGSNKKVVSLNFQHSYGESFDEKATRENLYLEKDVPTEMADYLITYRGDSSEGPNNYYQVDYQNKNGKENFSLFPNAQFNENQGLMPNPDTKRYLTKDIFTHVTSVPRKDAKEDWETGKEYKMSIGDTLFVNKNVVVFRGVDKVMGGTISKDLDGHTLNVGAFEVVRGDSTYYQKPVFGQTLVSDYTILNQSEKTGLRFTFSQKKDQTDGAYNVIIDTKEVVPDYIIMKAIMFPWINLLWGGTIIMILGFILSIRHRIREVKIING
jgi:cytochrome c-type biogenesis protein CcmF